MFVVFRDCADQYGVAGLEIVAGIGIARSQRILETNAIDVPLGGETVTVPVLMQGVTAVAHRDAAQHDVVHGALEGNAFREVVAILMLAVTDDVLEQNVMRVVLKTYGSLGEADHFQVS